MDLIRHIRRNLPHYFVALLTILLVIAVALAHRYRLTQPPDLLDSLVHSLHGPGFSVIAVSAFVVLRLYHRQTANYLHAALVAMAIGLLAEAAQIPGPRDAEIMDLVVDAIGIIGGLGFLALFDRDIRRQFSKRRYLVLTVITAISLIISSLPTITYGYVWVAQQRAIPSILTFDDHWNFAIFGRRGRSQPVLVAAPEEWPVTGATVAYAEEVGRWGVLVRITTFPDWSEFGKLTFVAASGDGEEHEVQVTIRDIRPRGRTKTNRYEEKIIVKSKPRRFELSLQKLRDETSELGRPFDIEHVEAIVLSAWTPGTGVTVLLDDFRLEP